MDNWLYVQSTRIDPSDETSAQYIRLVTDDKFAIDDMYDRIRRYCEFASGQVILDEKGHPLEDYTKPRYLQYLVDMLQMDAKLAQVTVMKEDTSVGSNFGDDGPTARTYPTSVVTVLRNHFDNIGKARDTMFTNTRLFFEPIKSLGFARFNVGNGVIRELPLDVAMKFRLHVTKDVYEDDILLIQLKKQIIEIIDNHIDRNGYVNCAEIANEITADMNGSIKHVDVLGIDGDPELQTMKSVDKGVHAHLLRTSQDDALHVRYRRDAAAHRERDADRPRHRLHHPDVDRATLRRRRDVVEHQLVRSTVGIRQRHLHGIAEVDVVLELDALRHAPRAYVQAWNYAFCQHDTKSLSNTRPRRPDFSG